MEVLLVLVREGKDYFEATSEVFLVHPCSLYIYEDSVDFLFYPFFVFQPMVLDDLSIYIPPYNCLNTQFVKL